MGLFGSYLGLRILGSTPMCYQSRLLSLLLVVALANTQRRKTRGDRRRFFGFFADLTRGGGGAGGEVLLPEQCEGGRREKRFSGRRAFLTCARAEPPGGPRGRKQKVWVLAEPAATQQACILFGCPAAKGAAESLKWLAEPWLSAKCLLWVSVSKR